MKNLTENIEVRVVGAAVVAGSSIDNNSDRIDMNDYESVTFITTITDSADTGVATATVEQNDADSDTGMATVNDGEADAIATATSAANDDLNGKALVVEVRRPGARYVQLKRASATANIAYGEVIALLKPRQVPVVDHSTVAAKTHVSN